MARRGRSSLGKRIMRSKAIHYLLSHLAALIMRGIFLTCRVRREFHADVLPYVRGERPGIFCFWHGRMIMQPFIKPPKHKMFVLISLHNDGALITATMRRFGIDAARGSKKRGSRVAVRTMLDIAERGDNLCITPDGPRGPFQVAAPGASYIAAKTGYPMLPIAFSASRSWRLRSWDKFMIPKPFSVLHFTAGAPITVAAESDEATIAQFTETLSSKLRAVTAEADHACGVAA